MTAWVLLFDDWTVWARTWIPETAAVKVDQALGGQLDVWARQGWVTITDGDVIDYDLIYAAVAEDVARFAIRTGVYDRWSGEPVRQRILNDTGLELIESDTGYVAMSTPLAELQAAIKARRLRHLGNPVLRWHADTLEVRRPRDNAQMMRPVKPDRINGRTRIDAVAALLQAIRARQVWEARAEEDPRTMDQRVW